MYKVMVGPGDKVAPGDPLIVMIAMKMEYVIKVISRTLNQHHEDGVCHHQGNKNH